MSIRSAMMRAAAGLQSGPVGGISLVGFEEGNVLGAISITINKPAATSENNLMLALVCGSNNQTWANSAGWTFQGTVGVQHGIYTKTAGVSEPSTYSFSTGASNDKTGIILVYSGAVLDVVGSYGVNGNPIVASAVTGTAGGKLISKYYASGNVGVTYSTPSGMNFIASYNTQRPSYAVFDETLTTTGNPGTRTSSSSSNGVGFLISIKPG